MAWTSEKKGIIPRQRGLHVGRLPSLLAGIHENSWLEVGLAVLNRGSPVSSPGFVPAGKLHIYAQGDGHKLVCCKIAYNHKGQTNL